MTFSLCCLRIYSLEPKLLYSHFRYNDDSVLFGKSIDINAPSTSAASTFHGKYIPQKSNLEKAKPKKMSESSSDGDEILISSDADSDFIDVPEMDDDNEVDEAFLARAKLPLPSIFLMNESPVRVPIGSEPKDSSSNDTKIEVVINPGQMCGIGDDIFADIFDQTDEEPVARRGNQRNIFSNSVGEVEISESEENSVIEIDDSPIESTQEIEVNRIELESESKFHSPKSIGNDIRSEETEPVEKSSDSKIQSILNGLDDQRSVITKLSLDDLLGTKSNDLDLPQKESQNSNNLEFLEKLRQNEKEPSDLEEKLSTPTKIPQPFFVKKTPPSSKKKSPGNAKNENDLTPSKAVKSLSDVFESLPSTSAEPISEKDTMDMAANVLRDKKSREELQDIAEQLNQERRDLMAERNKKDRLGVSITDQMSMECMELLRLFGVPYVVAPMEAEAQCAYLNEIDLTEGTITDDSDIWLFGGKTVYKNFFDQNKHVLEFKSDNIQRLFHLDRDKLIQLSFLVGSDYTQGKK